MVDFTQFGILANVAIFVVAAALVWIAGSRITRYANVISQKTGIGQAFIGLLLLGGVTSLPELAVAITSAVAESPALAVNGLLGGIAMQVAILAFADVLIGRKALTSVIPDPVIFIQGGLKILLLSIVAAAIMVGDRPVFGAGLWMWLLLAVAAVSMWVLAKSQGRKPWTANDAQTETGEAEQQQKAKEKAAEDKEKPLSWALTRSAIAGAVIIAAGYVLSRTADALADQTGLGESFVGAVFLAISTSLPEVSTVYSAARAGLYTMAISDIFGTNLFDVSFLFIIDIVDGGGAAMNESGSFSGFAALIAITVTTVFLVGLAERRDRTILRMGYDSAAVLTIYLCGLVVLYFLR